VKPLRKELADLARNYTQRLVEQRLSKIPESVRDKVRKTIQTPEAKRNREQKELAAKYEKQLHVDPKELPAAFPEFKQKSAARASWRRPTTSGAWEPRRLTPSCWTGWPANLSRTAGASKSCTGSS